MLRVLPATLMGMLLSWNALATTFTVTDPADNLNPGTLRTGLSSGADTILFDPAINEIMLSSTLSISTNQLNIIAPVGKVTFNAQNTVNIFNITANNVVIHGVRMINGYSSGAGGGAINNSGVNLLVDSCIFEFNGSGLNGGAISSSSSLTVKACHFAYNNGGAQGGAIHSQAAGLTVERSSFMNNIAGTDGGAISVISPPSSPFFTNCTFSANNSTQRGSAIFIANPTAAASMQFCSFESNSSGSNQGSIAVDAPAPVNVILFESCALSGPTPVFMAFNLASSGSNGYNYCVDNSMAGILGQPTDVTQIGLGLLPPMKTGHTYVLPPVCGSPLLSVVPAGTVTNSQNGRPRANPSAVGAYEPPAYTTTRTVTSLANDGNNTLREHVATTCPGDTIVFATTGSIFLEQPIQWGHPLHILGPGANQVTLDGQAIYQILYATAGRQHIRGLKFTNGFESSGNMGGAILCYDKLTVVDCEFMGNSCDMDAGAIYSTDSTWIISSVFSNNDASIGYGGAIYTTGHLAVDSCEFSYNSASNSGAIYTDGGMDINHTSFIQNDASAESGAIGTGWSPGVRRIRNSTFDGNTSYWWGGGINSYGDSLVVENTVFKNNVCSNDWGGAIMTQYDYTLKNCSFVNNQANAGGAISSMEGYGLIENCVFVDNTATFEAGAIRMEFGGLRVNGVPGLYHNTFLGNSAVDGRDLYMNDYSGASDIDMYANVFAKGNGSGGTSMTINGGGAIFLSQGYNVSYTTILNAAAPDVQNTNPMVSYGGYLPNGHYLTQIQCSSPAFNLAVSSPTPNDMLGRPRVGVADAGAYERQAIPPVYATDTIVFCLNDQPLPLNNIVDPSAGQWSGSGVAQSTFYPSVAGAGFHTLNHQLVDTSGCVFTGGVVADVQDAAMPIFSVTDATCGSDDGEVTLTNFSSFTNVNWVTTGDSLVATTDTLDAGVYHMEAFDASNGCPVAASADVNSVGLQLSGNAIDPSCAGSTDGGVNLTINGTGPFTVLWNNGSTSTNLTGVNAGTYNVEVTDASGCTSTAAFTLYDPAVIALNFTVTDAGCAATDGSATVAASGGASGFTYQWHDQGGVLAGQTSPTLSNVGSGQYYVIVSDVMSCTLLGNVVVTETGGPQVSLAALSEEGCGSGGSIDIDIVSPTGISTILWSNGATTEDISGLDAGFYSVEVSDPSGCTGVFGVDVNSQVPAGADICIVTVDVNTFTNKVVWSKETSSSISHYNIYRETSVLGQYMLMDTVQYASLSRWTDPVANPVVKSWRYQISVVDTCGNESPLSTPHKTIHLVKNLGLGNTINLSWNPYGGFSYGQHRIWRYTDVDGWNAIDSVTSAQLSYTDITIPVGATDIDYFIEVDRDSTCVASRAENYNSTRSNKTDPSIASPISLLARTASDMMVYPNPTAGNLFVRMTGLEHADRVIMTDISGKVVRVIGSDEIPGDLLLIDTHGLNTGGYIVHVFHGQGISRRQVVVH